MFPGVNGFHWTAGHLIFLGVFYSVLVVIGATLVLASLRALKNHRARRMEKIRWESDFHDLTASERACRHVFTGEFKNRVCERALDCRECGTHAKLIAKTGQPGPVEAEEMVLGMPLRMDRLYHRGHTWVQREQDGTVTVGLDELGSRLIGTPDRIEFPPVGTQLALNGTGWSITRGGASVRILSPVEGEVVATGGTPDGWYLKIRPAHQEFTHLLRGNEVRLWLMREMERLQLTLGRERGLAPALADGGVPVDDMPQAHPQADWDSVWGTMFLEP